jgi:hypothetical protein
MIMQLLEVLLLQDAQVELEKQVAKKTSGWKWNESR